MIGSYKKYVGIWNNGCEDWKLGIYAKIVNYGCEDWKVEQMWDFETRNKCEEQRLWMR